MALARMARAKLAQEFNEKLALMSARIGALEGQVRRLTNAKVQSATAVSAKNSLRDAFRTAVLDDLKIYEHVYVRDLQRMYPLIFRKEFIEEMVVEGVVAVRYVKSGPSGGRPSAKISLPE